MKQPVEQKRFWAAWISDPATLFVAAIFLILTIVVFRFKIHYAFPVPYWDDSGFIPYITGERAMDWAWLWSPSNEHRIPLIRLLYVLIARIGKDSELALNLANAVMLAVSAALTLVALRIANGKTQYTDAIVPFALLQFGQLTNIQFTIPACLECLLVGLLVLPDREDGLKYKLLPPAFLIIALSGVNGLVVALAISPTIVWLGLRMWRAGRRGHAAAAFFCVAIALLYTAVYNVGLPKIQYSGRPFLFSEGLVEGIKAASQCFGADSAEFWPYSGAMAIAILAAGLAASLNRFRSTPKTRFSSAAFSLMLIGFAGLAVTIGMGRTVLGPGAGFASRYSLILCPIPVVVLFSCDRFAPAEWQRFVRVAMFTVLCVLYWPSSGVMLADLDKKVADGQELERQVRAGVSIPKLADEFGARWMFTPANFAEKMRMLSDARMGVFRDLAPPSATADLMQELSTRTEVKGPLTSGSVFLLSTYNIAGNKGVIAHPPHVSSIRLPAGVKAVHFGFGVLPLPGLRPQGIDFKVSLRRRGHDPVSIWSRRIDPLRASGDVGLQEADVQLPQAAGVGDQLVFETAAVKSNFDCWAYWSDIKLR